MLKQKRVLKLCLGLLAFGITVSFSNLNRFGYFKNMVKAMEDVPASGLDIYKQNKENVKNVNSCYVRYPSENSVWPGGYRYFYLDFSNFLNDEQKKRLKYLEKQGCYVFGDVISPGNVDVDILQMKRKKKEYSYFYDLVTGRMFDVHDYDKNCVTFGSLLQTIKKVFVNGEDDELIKLLDELSSLEKSDDGRLFKYNELVNSLSADVNGKRCYDFKNVENNKRLYGEIVNLVDYLSDLELRQKSASIAKGIWYYDTELQYNLDYLKKHNYDEYTTKSSQAEKISKYLRAVRSFLNIWICHLASIGAFLERFFGLGNKFYQKENDKHAKYVYYKLKVINNECTFLNMFRTYSWKPKPDCERININISYDDNKYNELLLDIVNRDNKERLFSYRIPVNEDFESTVFNFLVAARKIKAKRLLEQNPEFAKLKQDPKLAEKEEKEKLISLIDKAVVVNDNSNKLNINNIHMSKDVLGQIIDDVINETKEIAKINNIVHHAVDGEVDRAVRKIQNEMLSDNTTKGIDYSTLKDKFLKELEYLSEDLSSFYYIPSKLLEDIFENINSEFKQQNIDEPKLYNIIDSYDVDWCEEKIAGFAGYALIREKEISEISLE